VTYHNDTLSDAFTHPAIKHELTALREEVKRLRQELKDANETTLVIARQRDELQEKYDRIRRGPPPVQATNQSITLPACPHTETTYHPDGSGNNDSWYECKACRRDVTKTVRARMQLAAIEAEMAAKPKCPTHTFVTPDVYGCGKRDVEHDP